MVVFLKVNAKGNGLSNFELSGNPEGKYFSVKKCKFR